MKNFKFFAMTYLIGLCILGTIGAFADDPNPTMPEPIRGVVSPAENQVIERGFTLEQRVLQGEAGWQEAMNAALEALKSPALTPSELKDPKVAFRRYISLKRIVLDEDDYLVTAWEQSQHTLSGLELGKILVDHRMKIQREIITAMIENLPPSSELISKIFIMAKKCISVEPNNITFSYQAGQSNYVSTSDFSKGPLEFLEKNDKGTLKIKMTLGPKGKLVINTLYTSQDESKTMTSKLIAPFGVEVYSGSGNCERPQDIGSYLINTSTGKI